MKRHALVALWVVMVCAVGTVNAAPTTATTQDTDDIKSFELTAVAPPTPLLKYSFQYPYVERLPGNAAPIYLDAVLLMKPGTQDKADKALDAYYDGKDFKTFDQLAEELDVPAVWMEIDQAGRRIDCDFNAPLHEMAANTLLPHLQFLAHGLEKSLEIRALRQIRQGKIDDAILTLRQAYVLADNINEPVLVSGLVSTACTRVTNRVLVELMSRPDAPNLYWAIRELPSKRTALRRAWDCETSWIYFQSPGLKRFATGAPLSAPEWRRVLIDDMLPLYTIVDNYDFKGAKVTAHPDPIKDASPQTLQNARSAYAQAHNLSSDDAAKVDSAIVLGEYYVHEVRIAMDRQARLRVLSYPELLARLPEADTEAAAFKKNNSGNPLALFVATFHKAVWTFARTDRQISALAAVEAIRSYAAANGGALPKSLDEVTETPVPENPATGKPFEYRVENNVATLSDSKSESPLTYTIKIRH